MFKKYNYDDESRINFHSRIYQKKSMLREIFDEFNHYFFQEFERIESKNKPIIEIGSGVHMLKSKKYTVFNSDIILSQFSNVVFDAHKMPFPKSSISALYLQNTFHHLNDPFKFFSECNRVLCKGGIIVIIDPYYNLFSTILYKLITNVEVFDKNGPLKQKDLKAMSHANQAQSFIIFKRELEIFKKTFPNFEITNKRILNNNLRYLFSGGLNFSQILPDICIPFLKFFEKSNLIRKYFGIHHLIVIKKH